MAHSLQFCEVCIDNDKYTYDRTTKEITFKLYNERDKNIIHHLYTVSEVEAETLQTEQDLLNFINTL